MGGSDVNVRKPTDYTDFYRGLDALVTAALPQMELYYEIGKLISARPEKGAAVAAAEHLTGTYPDVSGFSPRNLRRMRKFYRAYANSPEIKAQAMLIGWTQNAVILENCVTDEDRTWYISAVRRFHWSKTELMEKITEGTHEDTTPLLYSAETAEEKPPLSMIDASNAVTSKARSQANFSRLADPDVIHWTKPEVQDQQKSGEEQAQTGLTM